MSTKKAQKSPTPSHYIHHQILEFNQTEIVKQSGYLLQQCSLHIVRPVVVSSEELQVILIDQLGCHVCLPWYVPLQHLQYENYQKKLEIKKNFKNSKSQVFHNPVAGCVPTNPLGFSKDAQEQSVGFFFLQIAQ